MQAQDIIQFWFSELSNKQRFAKDPELDAAMRERFGPTLQAAISGDLASWRTSATGRLAGAFLDELTSPPAELVQSIATLDAKLVRSMKPTQAP